MTDWPTRTIRITRNRLPHWTAENATYFVTFRLADAIPPADAWHLRQQKRAHKLADEILDRSLGGCWLRDHRIARTVDDSLRRFDEQRYLLHAWAIMPNHVHVAVRALRPLERIMHSWKSFTAAEANKLLGRRGAFWQRESFDSLLHDQNDLDRMIRYVVENPVRAGLKDWPWVSVLRTEFLM